MLLPVMWSETISLRTKPVSDQKTGLGLGLARCGLDLRLDLTVPFKVSLFCILCLEHHYCGDEQWRLLT